MQPEQKCASASRVKNLNKFVQNKVLCESLALFQLKKLGALKKMVYVSICIGLSRATTAYTLIYRLGFFGVLRLWLFSRLGLELLFSPAQDYKSGSMLRTLEKTKQS